MRAVARMFVDGAHGVIRCVGHEGEGRIMSPGPLSCLKRLDHLLSAGNRILSRMVMWGWSCRVFRKSATAPLPQSVSQLRPW